VLSPLLAAFLGGLGAVAAEVVFTRKLALLFGVTAPAAGTVVAVTMAGMALGSAFGGRLADRMGAKAGRVYVGGELLVGVWALVWPWLFVLADDWTVSVPQEWSLVACALATLVLVGPWAIAGGATFPALSRLVGREGEVRRLYAVNALGAAVGAVMAGLWLPDWLGLDATLRLAGVCSAAAGLSLIARAAGRIEVAELAPQLTLRQAAAAYGVIGGLGMGAEIGFTRLLQQTGPNPGGLAFALALATYLVGLCIGGLALQPRLEKLGERGALGFAALFGAASLGLVLAVLPVIPPEMLVGHAVGPSPGNVLIFEVTGLQIGADRLAIYLFGVLGPGIAAGGGFPIAAAAVAREQRKRVQSLGAGVGLAGATGITAAVLVSLWMGFLPALGTIRTLVLMVAGAFVCSAVLTRRKTVGALALASLGLLAVPPWAGLQIPADETVEVFLETAAGPSAVAHGPRESSVYTHGERVAGMRLDLTIPMVLHPEPKDVLQIAFGTGVNVAVMMDDQGVESLTCVDIDSALPTLAEQLPQVGRPLFDEEKARFVNQDGRHLLRSSDRQYDLIYSDVATYAQYVQLGTVEFFELARSRLKPGGLFTVKVHLDTLTAEGMWRFLATFQEVFPEAALFAGRTPHLTLVGFTSAPPSLEQMEKRAAESVIVAPDAAKKTPAMVLLGPQALAELDWPVSTDDHPLPFRTALVGPLTDEAVARSCSRVLHDAVKANPGEGERFFGWQVGPTDWKPAPLEPVGPRAPWF
jgi:spermidine synthase